MLQIIQTLSYYNRLNHTKDKLLAEVTSNNLYCENKSLRVGCVIANIEFLKFHMTEIISKT